MYWSNCFDHFSSQIGELSHDQLHQTVWNNWKFGDKQIIKPENVTFEFGSNTSMKIQASAKANIIQHSFCKFCTTLKILTLQKFHRRIPLMTKLRKSTPNQRPTLYRVFHLVFTYFKWICLWNLWYFGLCCKDQNWFDKWQFYMADFLISKK